MKKTFFILIIIITMTSCGVHKMQSVKPPPNMNSQFIETMPDIVMDHSHNKWWAAFNDSNLNTLMEEAFTKNLDLIQSYARLTQSKATAKSTKSALFPSIDIRGNSNISKQDKEFGMPDIPDDISTQPLPGERQYQGGEYGGQGSAYGGQMGGGQGGGSDYHNLSLAVSYELDLWKKIKYQTTAANLEQQASSLDIHTMYITLSAQIGEHYFRIIEKNNQLNIINKIIVSHEETLTLTKENYELGLVTSSDVYQARQNLEAAKARVPSLEASRGTAKHALAYTLGKYPDKHIGNTKSELPDTPPMVDPGVPSELLRNRPDIQAALFRLKGSDARIGAKIAERFPSIILSPSGGFSKTDDFSWSFVSLAANLTKGLFDRGKNKAEVKKQKAVFKENFAKYHQIILKAFQEVEDALSNNWTTKQRIDFLKAQVKASKANLDLAKERYIHGITNYLPVLNARIQFLEVTSQLVAARGQLIIDRISLARAVGGKWTQDEMEKGINSNSLSINN